MLEDDVSQGVRTQTSRREARVGVRIRLDGQALRARTIAERLSPEVDAKAKVKAKVKAKAKAKANA
jgi:hypothetical protein